MRAKAQRVLSVAARAGRVGFVLLHNGDLQMWKASEKASESADSAARSLRQWVDAYRPDCLISQNPDTAGKKSGKQIDILQALARSGDDMPILNLVVLRTQPFANAYAEAKALAKQFPELKSFVPKKPKIWQSEPYRLVIFEALALVRDAGLLPKTTHNS